VMSVMLQGVPYVSNSKSHYDRSSSRPVRLGVLPLLEQVTRCYISSCDNYFLYFSCRAPSLMRGLVCNYSAMIQVQFQVTSICLPDSSVLVVIVN
jgi:hypothetical protein